METEFNTRKCSEEKLYLQTLQAENERVLCTRPINCPIAECGRITSVQEYPMHVRVEHPNIPRPVVKVNHQETIEVKLEHMAYGKTYCVAMLLVKTSKNNSAETAFKDCMALPVFVAKLECCVNKKTEDQLPPSESSTEAMQRAMVAKKAFDRHRKPSTPIKDTNNSQRETNYIYGLLEMFGASTKNLHDMARPAMSNICADLYQDLNDIVLIWVAGKIDDNYRCLLQVRDESGREGHYFNGKLHAIKESNNSRDILLTGNHLLLHTSNIQKKAGYKNNVFKLDVFILGKE